MVGDQWQDVMYNAIQANGSFAVAYFVGLVLIGNFIMLNLFLTVLLGNFELASLKTRGTHEDNILKKFENKVL